MNIYSHKFDYRRFYEKHHGPIPKDSIGRSLEIHHIDGNHSNNDINNLKLVTIKEHYKIHYAQGDWAACLSMANRMKISPEEKSELAKQSNAKRIKNGTHPFLDPMLAHNRWKKMKAAGINPWATPEAVEKSKKLAQARLDNGTHNFQGDNNPSRKLVKEGKHNWQGPDSNARRLADGTHPSQKTKTCLHCGKTMNLMLFGRYHGNRCKNILSI